MQAGLVPRTDAARLVDMTRLDAHLAPQGIDDPWAVGTNKTRLGLAFQRIHDLRVNDKKPVIRVAGPTAVERLTRISSAWGMPSVMQTIRPISFSIASMMASAALGGGTYSTDASGWVSRTAWDETEVF